jgi:hypothetical protein
LKPWRRFSGEVKRRGGELGEERGSFKLDLGSPRVMIPGAVAFEAAGGNDDHGQFGNERLGKELVTN